jgi:hypothetical protein
MHSGSEANAPYSVVAIIIELTPDAELETDPTLVKRLVVAIKSANNHTHIQSAGLVAKFTCEPENVPVAATCDTFDSTGLELPVLQRISPVFRPNPGPFYALWPSALDIHCRSQGSAASQNNHHNNQRNTTREFSLWGRQHICPFVFVFIFTSLITLCP